MELVSVLIAAFSFLFSASVFSMETPVYGFVDSPHVVQSFVVGDLDIPEDNKQMVADKSLIEKTQSLADNGIDRWRNIDRQLPVLSPASPRLVFEIGWQSTLG